MIGLIEDPVRWRDVVWVCLDHRAAELKRRREVSAQRAYETQQAAWYDERAHVLAAIELLPPAERTRLHALAAIGPAGTQLAPAAPLYVMNLVRAYKGRAVTSLRHDALAPPSPRDPSLVEAHLRLGATTP